MLGLELLDHVADRVVVKMWALQFVTYDVLDLVRVESDDMPLEVVHVHIRRELRVGDRRVRRRDHRCPGADVDFVDVLDDVLEAELEYARRRVGRFDVTKGRCHVPSQPCS